MYPRPAGCSAPVTLQHVLEMLILRRMANIYEQMDIHDEYQFAAAALEL